MLYIYQQSDWPAFRWKASALADILARVRHRQGKLLGHLEALGFPLRQEALLETLSSDVLKTSEIEGERLNAEQVRSSLARKLGMEAGALKAADRNVEGIVEMTLDATRNYRQPLTGARLFSWHAALFPTGYSGLKKIRAGAWREGPMEVVSGAMGKERIHYEAPPAATLDAEMHAFLAWFNTEGDQDWVMRAALAHLWFVTIHPFDDGNGRIARAVADLALARSEDSPRRFYSMSSQIRKERSDYYDILEATQKGGLDVTPWMKWFLSCLERAIGSAQVALAKVLGKARFWESIADVPLNPRQRKMLNRILDGIEGPLTNAKWAKMAKCSADTALRDLQYLVEKRILVRGEAGGRSSSYSIAAKTRWSSRPPFPSSY